ncbi:MAG: cytidine deaminase [Patescibacteria group bacterium]|jgi:cytidine deaminase
MDPKELLLIAIQAAENTHSPYSHFPVGAAAVGESGTVYTGCNVENASLGLTICAERVAIFKAISSGERRIAMLACACINGDPNEPRTLMPCGACRQVMAEFMDDDSQVIISLGKTGSGIYRLRDLLPEAFRL